MPDALNPTPEEVALLDRISEEHWPNFDQAVLAAIIETTERAAKLVDQGQYNRVHLATPMSIADALRRGDHLK